MHQFRAAGAIPDSFSAQLGFTTTRRGRMMARPHDCETYALPTALSPPCPFARFADVGLKWLNHRGARQAEFGPTREVCVLLFDVQKHTAASRVGDHPRARFSVGLVGIGRFYKQSLPNFAVGEAWALRMVRELRSHPLQKHLWSSGYDVSLTR